MGSMRRWKAPVMNVRPVSRSALWERSPSRHQPPRTLSTPPVGSRGLLSEILSAKGEITGPQQTERKGREKIRCGGNVPQERPAKGSERHNHIPHQVVGSEHSRLSSLRRKIHDQRFPGRFPEFLESPQDKGQDQRFKGSTPQKHQRKESEKQEGDHHKRFLCTSIRQISHRDVNEHRSEER